MSFPKSFPKRDHTSGQTAWLGVITADELLRQQEAEGHGPVAALPRAAVSEISGPAGGGKTEWVVSRLANPASQGRIAWLEESLTLYPCALAQAGVALDRVYFIETGAQALLSCTQQVIRSGLFESVVVTRPRAARWEERTWRRLQLVAEPTRTALIVIGEEATREGSWVLALQVEVRREGEGALRTQVLRRTQKGETAWKVRSIG